MTAHEIDFATCMGSQHAADKVWIPCGKPATEVIVRIECGAPGRGLIIEVCHDCARRVTLWPSLA